MSLVPFEINNSATKSAQTAQVVIVIHCQLIMIPLVSISEISKILLVSMAKHVGLCLTWLQY